MSPEYEFRPGEWPDVAIPRNYERLVALARRRMVGYELLAEDAVSCALIRWSRLSTDLRSVARLETVVASEAHSMVRSEVRRRARERRVAGDRRTNELRRTDGDDLEAVLLQIEIERAACQCHRSASTDEIRVIELLGTGMTIAEICRSCGYSRHYVNEVRRRWRSLLYQSFKLAEDA